MSPRFTMHHLSIFVRDVHASAKFYGEVLGLEEIPNRVAKSHIRWFIIDGFRTIHLIGGDPEAERQRPLSTHIAFATPDFDEALDRLKQHGVNIVDPERRPQGVITRPDGVRQLYFQDPDGHWIEFNDANEIP